MSVKATRYEALAEQIESALRELHGGVAHVRDENTRRRLIYGGRKLAASLELPRDIVHRIGYSVNISVHSPFNS